MKCSCCRHVSCERLQPRRTWKNEWPLPLLVFCRSYNHLSHFNDLHSKSLAVRITRTRNGEISMFELIPKDSRVDNNVNEVQSLYFNRIHAVKIPTKFRILRPPKGSRAPSLQGVF